MKLMLIGLTVLMFVAVAMSTANGSKYVNSVTKYVSSSTI